MRVKSRTTSTAPAAPSGCPRTIAPPSGLRSASSKPKRLAKRDGLRGRGLAHLDDADVLGLEAVEPAVELLHRLDRRAGLVLRRHAFDDARDEAQRRGLPSSIQTFSDTTTTNAAPSCRALVLPGVSVPSGATKRRELLEVLRIGLDRALVARLLGVGPERHDLADEALRRRAPSRP